jgi:hypothetical protein
MGIVFKNPEVAAKYEALREKDGKVHIPGGSKIPGQERAGFMGPLSLITLAAADKAYASGSNLLKLKEPVTSGSGSNNRTRTIKEE